MSNDPRGPWRDGGGLGARIEARAGVRMCKWAERVLSKLDFVGCTVS